MKKDTIMFCGRECKVIERYTITEEYAKKYQLVYRNRIKYVDFNGMIHDVADTFSEV